MGAEGAPSALPPFSATARLHKPPVHRKHHQQASPPPLAPPPPRNEYGQPTNKRIIQRYGTGHRLYYTVTGFHGTITTPHQFQGVPGAARHAPQVPRQEHKVSPWAPHQGTLGRGVDTKGTGGCTGGQWQQHSYSNQAAPPPLSKDTNILDQQKQVMHETWHWTSGVLHDAPPPKKNPLLL